MISRIGILTLISRLLLAAAIPIRAQQTDFPKLTGPYLGQKPPGLASEIFAPGILSRYSMLHGKLVFSPDGLEAFWTCNAAPVQSRWTAHQTPQGLWTAPEKSFFSIDYVENSIVYSVDGKRLYFHSRRPLQGTGAPKDKDIWYREKTSKGWGDPVSLGPPVNLPTSDESAPSVAADGTLFFSRQETMGAHGAPGHGTAQIDIYYSEWKNGAYAEPVRMGPEINSEYPEIDPVIAPDKSYLLFTSARPGGYSRMMNLYVSYRTTDGRWTPAQSLSHTLKVDNIWFPSLSADGAYLFFCGGYPTEKGYADSQYYWVSAKISDALKPEGLTSLFTKQSDFSKLTGPYLGQKPPGTIPELFAPGVVAGIEEHQNCLTFSPDGREIYWGRYYKDKKINKILVTKYENGRWTQPQFAVFSGGTNCNDDAPFISPDGRRLLFNSRRPLDENDTTNTERIWVVEKMGSSWKEPKPLSKSLVNLRFHMQFSVSENGELYYHSRNNGTQGSSDIFSSRSINNEYSTPEKLGENINTEYFEMTPFIAPDESYLLFARNRIPYGFGLADLYISYRTSDGGWTQAVNLGETVNTKFNEACPIISPDGKYLFFNSDRRGKSDIYWVDAKIIDELRPKK